MNSMAGMLPPGSGSEPRCGCAICKCQVCAGCDAAENAVQGAIMPADVWNICVTRSLWSEDRICRDGDIRIDHWRISGLLSKTGEKGRTNIRCADISVRAAVCEIVRSRAHGLEHANAD